jgi:outer membrane protein assembly factor BamB
VYVGSDGGVLYKLDAKTGKMLQSVKVGGPVRAAPTVEDGTVYFGSADFHCYAASTDTLGLLWSFTTGGTVLTSPCIAGDDVIFASSDSAVTCVAKTSGRKQWALDFEGDPTASPPAYTDGTLYVGAGNTLYAIDAQNGSTQWKRPLSAAATDAPTLWPGGIGVGALDGTLSVFGHGGRLRWRDGLGSPSLAPALVAGSLILVPTQYGALYALQADTGRLAWEYVTPASTAKKVAPPETAEISSAPLLANGTLYLLSDDGTLSALRADAISALPPHATALTPTPGSTIAGTSVAPSARVIALGCGLDPSSVSLTLDGQPLAGVAYSAAQSQVALDPTTLSRLDDGAHELVLKATDWRGNTLTQSWGFFVDNALDPQTTTP